ncbi:hypothetical protein [Novipirellula maiorica]|uniref:hypothetical protein n=1 Tax=Novipirellula maiorica TaxID=1265734 RepID=UPI00068AD10D|nr:hypothetical protein [Rhodopirellula maiorica]
MKNVIMILMNLVIASQCGAADWLTLPGKFSHDPVTAQRVEQFQPPATPAVAEVANFRTSGYTHVRSRLNYAQSSDNYHRVETWGDPVRPYGEWQRPFRPYSVPYAAWGAPFAGLNITPYGYGLPYGNGVGAFDGAGGPGFGGDGLGRPGNRKHGNGHDGIGDQGDIPHAPNRYRSGYPPQTDWPRR